MPHLESLEIESRNETAQSIENVDAVEYGEIDKSHIKVSTPRKTNQAKTSTIFKKEVVKNTRIEEMNFTVRTYNCLRRVGLKIHLTWLSGQDSNTKELILYLGRIGQEEIVCKLSEHRLKLVGE